MHRLLFLFLLLVFFRLLTLAEAVAYVQDLGEPDSFVDAIELDRSAELAARPYVLDPSDADYDDYSARAPWQPNSSGLLLELADELPRERLHPLAMAGSDSGAGISLSTPLRAGEIALEPSGIVPRRLDRPSYYATAPPSPQ